MIRFVSVWLLSGPAVVLGNSPPIISSLPVVSADTVVADDTTLYDVTMTASDADGYDDLRCLRVLFNLTEASPDDTLGRGYMAWGRTDGDITQYGGSWVLDDATGGGRWGYRTDAWGGTTYLTPGSCSMATAGSASGGTGTRTVTWTFTAKPAWAFNPLMNDADAWTADYSSNVGWADNPVEFDVVASPCVTWSATPRPPIVSNPTPTTLDVAIDPDDSATDFFAIRIAPDLHDKAYMQADGSVGAAAQWQTKANWGQTTVSGLMWDTSYTFSVRAAYNSPGNCPSPFGPGADGTTEAEVPLIDFHQGTPFSPWTRGQCPYRSVAAGTWAWDALWDLTIGSMGRGLAGGLDADCYDWRDIDSGSGWGTPEWSGRFTTLEFLQAARDHNATPVITANAFGGGYRDWTRDGVFVCQTVNPDGLATDWVRYTNFIVQNYRQGQEGSLTGEDLRVYNSIVNWGGKPKLLAPDEGAVPRVEYWEIGNEPEVPGYGDFLTDHYLSPTDYRDRYKLISTAMKALDPTLKFGPCLTNPSDPNGSGQWLNALAGDPTIPIDFVAYHPYYNLKSNWGNPAGMTDALTAFKAYLVTRTEGIRTIMAQHGRSGYELMATEWNPMNWDATGQQQRSVAQGLGTVEGVFTFAENDVLAAHFWEQPQSKLAVRDAFSAMRDHLGDTLVSNIQLMGLSPENVNWRIYASKQSGQDNTLMIWGLNFNEDEPVEVDLTLAPSRIESAVLKRYGIPGGDTSLMSSSGMVWEQEDITAGFNTANFRFPMEDAEVTLLILSIAPVPPVDFDRDGDVDQSDFGRFQACLTGPGVPQTDPDCRDANLDGDSDVDQDDFGIFEGCMSGANMPADPDCAG